MRRSNKLSLYIKASLIFLAVSFLFSSCKKEETDNSIGTSGGNSIPVTGKATVKVNMLGEIFETVEGAAPGASGTSVNAATMNIQEGVQHQVIPFNKDFNLVADLIPVSSNINNTVQSSAKGAEMSSLQTDLDPGIKYKVAVYEYSTGNYVTERNYVRGSEQMTDSLNLDGGSKYTFVAYSVGSTTALPNVTFADSTAKNLNNSSFIANLAFNQRAMYYRIDLQLTGGQTNYLNVVLKNELSQITATIDASTIGVVSQLGAMTFLPSDNADNIKFQDGSISTAHINPIQDFLNGIVPAQGILFQFPNLGSTTIVTSRPTPLCNLSTTIPYINISSITVNGIQKNDITIPNVIITPGVKYNLNIKLTKP